MYKIIFNDSEGTTLKTTILPTDIDTLEKAHSIAPQFVDQVMQSIMGSLINEWDIVDV